MSKITGRLKIEEPNNIEEEIKKVDPMSDCKINTKKVLGWTCKTERGKKQKMHILKNGKEKMYEEKVKENIMFRKILED